MDLPPVGDGIWICGSCNQPNQIALADEKCPNCSHVRDYGVGCCTNPGEYPPSSALSHGYHGYQDENCSLPCTGYHVRGGVTDGPDDLWICTECGAENCDWCSECPLCGTSKGASMQYDMALPTHTFGPAGKPAPDIWECSECGATNSAVHWNQCGECGYLN